MKTKKELNAMKEEIETVIGKLNELTSEELEQISGGIDDQKVYPPEQWKNFIMSRH